MALEVCKRTQHMRYERTQETGRRLWGTRGGKVGDIKGTMSRAHFAQKCYNNVEYLVC